MDGTEVRRLLTRFQGESAALADELAEARRQIEHLQTALATNRQIAIAIGIVMARRALTEDQAFDLLRNTSQHTHRRIRDLAEEIVYTGQFGEAVAG